MSDVGKKVRQGAIWVLGITGGLANLFMYLRGQIMWGIFLSIVIALVCLFEVVNYFFLKKSTISNVWKAWAQKEPFWAYTTLALMTTAFLALCVHLAVW